jgi:hypothetical protein
MMSWFQSLLSFKINVLYRLRRGDELTLSAHGINAATGAPPLAWAHTTERLHALVVTRDGRHLVTVGLYTLNMQLTPSFICIYPDTCNTKTEKYVKYISGLSGIFVSSKAPGFNP